MKDSLDLNYSSSIGNSIYPSKEIEEHGKKLLSISDLNKKLEYYNKHICSLAYSYSGEGLHCFGEYEHYHGSGKVFFNVTSGSDVEFEIYLVERQKEIDRLKYLINEHQEYFDKLKCFIEEKAGQVRFDELQVKSNAWETFILNGGGTTPEHLLRSNNEIDLRPKSDERTSFNLYLRSYIQRLIEAPEALHWIVEQKYEGFLFSLGIEAFKQQLGRVSDREAAIKIELKRIEKKFNYNSLSDYREHIYPYKIENFNLWQSALFNAFVNGYEFDYGRKQMTPEEMKVLVHVEQVFAYYREVNKITSILTEEKGNETPTKSKLDFTKDKLRKIILELAVLNGYEMPSTYLNELLGEVKRFNDFDFESNFFLNVHYLCKENSDKFWSQSHKQDISKWLKKARAVTDVFDTTWGNSTLLPETSRTLLFNEPILQSVDDLKTFFDRVNRQDATAEESLKKGFKTLHDYINKDVHNDVNADLATLHLRETTLYNWKVHLEHNEILNSGRWKPKTEKIISHINGALEIIRLRIKRKEQAIPTELTQRKKEQQIKPEFAPKLFKELFNNPALINGCLELLKTTDKPCINDENQFIRNKGAFVVWFNALEKKRILNYTFSNDAERAATLNYNFHSLDISESLFRQSNTRATDRYKNHFENEISVIKD